MKPDYGLMLLRGGWGHVRQHFYGVPVTDLSVCAPGLFTFCLNRMHDGVEYAMSFDFNSAQVGDLLRKSHQRSPDLSAKVAQAQIGDTIEFGVPILVNIEATLGQPQRNDKEEYVPLVVSRVS
jgi:hypothetical protein